MTMNENMQGGDSDNLAGYFRYTLPYLIGGGKKSAIDFCSGTRFKFPKYVQSNNVDVVFDCLDIHKPDHIIRPSNVRHFFERSVETPLNLEDQYDIVTCFEGMEHIDHTDVFLKNCYSCLKDNGYLILAIPNLASIFCRIELLIGRQPHILEVSNSAGAANLGMGIFGKLNNPSNVPLHHIRGITYRAAKELLNFHGFEIVETYGSMDSAGKIFSKLVSCVPGISTTILYIAKKR